MDRECSADEANRGRSRSEPIQCSLSRLHHRGLVGEPEIVVRGKNDDLAPSFHSHPRPLRPIQEIQAFIGAVADEILQLRGDALLEGVAHAHTSRITLPAWPSLMT